MSNKFNFRADEFRGEAIDVKAEQFDYQLEQLLSKRKEPKPSSIKPGEDADLLLLAIRLKQEAPQPVRPSSAFQARLGAELQKRAQQQLVAAKRPQKSRSFGWRLAGGLALTTAFALVAAVTMVVANPFAPAASNSNVGSVSGLKVNTAALATSSLAALTTIAPSLSFSTESAAEEITPVPTSKNDIELTAANTSNATLTSLSVPQFGGSTPQIVSPFLSATVNGSSGKSNITDFNFNVEATMPALTDSSQVFHEHLVQISQTDMLKLGQQLGFDPSNAKFSTVQDNSSPAANITPMAYILSNSTSKTLKISNEGELNYRDDNAVTTSTNNKLLSQPATQKVAIDFLGKLGLSLNNSQWSNFQITASPVPTTNEVSLQQIVFSPTSFAPKSGQTEKLLTNSRAMTLTVNDNGQIVEFDSSLPLSINEQGQLTFAPMDVITSQAITAGQLQQDLSQNHSQIQFTEQTMQRLAQQNFGLQPNIIVNLDKMELGYMITTNKQSDMMLVPVILIYGTATINNQSVEIEGYIPQVQI